MARKREEAAGKKKEKKEMPRRHEASGETDAPRRERAKKEQTPVSDRQYN